MHTYENVTIDRVGSASSIALIALNRPARSNGMTPKMAEELGYAVQECLNNESIKAIVLTGNGKHFCPGLDSDDARDLASRIAKGVYPKEPYDGNLRILHQVTLSIYNAFKPIIAAVNGAAAAGGLDLILACDYRLAARTARFGESYIKIGLPPLNGGAWLLRRIVRSSLAFRMVMTGEVLDAETALEIGLVDELHASEDLVRNAVTFAERVSVAPLSVIAFNKRELRNAGPLEDALARVYVAGIKFSQSTEFRSGSERLPGAAILGAGKEKDKDKPIE